MHPLGGRIPINTGSLTQVDHAPGIVPSPFG